MVALSRDLQRALRRLDTVDANVLQLAADLAALATHLTDDQPNPTRDTAPAVRSWLLADSPQFDAHADLAQLIWWVDRVYLRYSRARLSSCWLWHPEVIEELWWLRGAHADAYHPEDGSWLRVGDWHDRQRPGVERRINTLLGCCDLTRHADQHGRPADIGEPDPVPLTRHAAAVADTWTAHPRTAGPEPTAEQLAEAAELLDRQYRTHR
ncbi:hypothetical protein [Pseudonocardia sp.]|uniref:hypothetical protein n=1 Tax=Pseudonocardia sp. TaxID=60912 RepID=UPI003D0FA111